MDKSPFYFPLSIIYFIAWIVELTPALSEEAF